MSFPSPLSLEARLVFLAALRQLLREDFQSIHIEGLRKIENGQVESSAALAYRQDLPIGAKKQNQSFMRKQDICIDSSYLS